MINEYNMSNEELVREVKMIKFDFTFKRIGVQNKGLNGWSWKNITDSSGLKDIGENYYINNQKEKVMSYNYTYEMNLEYFANNNDFELSEDDLNDLFVYVEKEECSKERLLSLIEESGFDFDIEEYDNFYKVV